MQRLGGEGPQLARQGEATSGAFLGKLWGSRGKLLERHELGNLQRRQSVSSQGGPGEGGRGGGQRIQATEDRKP